LFLKSPPLLILASTSRYRRDLLERLGLAFSCIAPGVDEAPQPGERPQALVTRLARAKAAAVASQQPDAWVIGSDQAAVRSDETGTEWTLGKPGTESRCVEQLQSGSGRTIVFLTAVAVMRQEGNTLFEFVDSTRVKFRTLDQATIERYVAKERPLDCAGGFKSEGLGITLCESIDSADPSALIGLPLIRLSAALRSAGFELP
jgi:septum formation protein